MKTGLKMVVALLLLAVVLIGARDGIQELVAIAGKWEAWGLLAMYFVAGYGYEKGYIRIDVLVDPITGQPADGMKTWSGLPPVYLSEYDQDH